MNDPWSDIVIISKYSSRLAYTNSIESVDPSQTRIIWQLLRVFTTVTHLAGFRHIKVVKSTGSNFRTNMARI